MRRTALAALVMAGLAAAPALAQQIGPNAPTITTEGRASIKVAPDVAWITVTAESRALKTADAQRQNAAAIDSVKSSIRSAGVADEAMKTHSYSLYPQTQFVEGKSKVVGYLARHSLEIRVDELTKLGAIIEAAGASGATSISDIRYDVKDRTGIETRLLADAVRDGMKRVEAMAGGSGKTVLSVWQIQEQRFATGEPQPMYRMTAQNAAPATEISPGVVEIRAQVLLTVLLR